MTRGWGVCARFMPPRVRLLRWRGSCSVSRRMLRSPLLRWSLILLATTAVSMLIFVPADHPAQVICQSIWREGEVTTFVQDTQHRQPQSNDQVVSVARSSEQQEDEDQYSGPEPYPAVLDARQRHALHQRCHSDRLAEMLVAWHQRALREHGGIADLELEVIARARSNDFCAAALARLLRTLRGGHAATVLARSMAASTVAQLRAALGVELIFAGQGCAPEALLMVMVEFPEADLREAIIATLKSTKLGSPGIAKLNEALVAYGYKLDGETFARLTALTSREEQAARGAELQQRLIDSRRSVDERSRALGELSDLVSPRDLANVCRHLLTEPAMPELLARELALSLARRGDDADLAMLCQHHQTSIREVVARELAPKHGGMEWLLMLAADSEASVRAIALRRFASVSSEGRELAIRIVKLALANDREECVKLAAVRTMTALRVDVDQVELTQLSELAWKANDPTLRYAAITAMAVLAGERARVALTSLLDHQDEAVNARAQSALQGLPRVLK